MTFESCVEAAAFASTGDDAAYQWLLEAWLETSGHGSTPWPVLYLTAMAASARHDHETADQLWIEAVRERGAASALTVSRFVAASVANRDGSGRRRLWLVAAMTEVPAGQAATIEDDPGPTLDAAARLTERGDVAGAVLLLASVGQAHRSPAVTAQRRRLRGGRGRIGMSRADRRARAWIRRVQGSQVRVNRLSERLLFGLFALFAGIAAVAWFVDHHPDASPVLAGGMWVVALAVVPALVNVAVRYWHRVSPERIEVSRADRADRRRVPPRRCLTTQVLSGTGAAVYRELHLIPFADGDALARVRTALGPAVDLATCPGTRILWLTLLGERTQAVHLLRGAAGAGRTTAPAPGMYI